MRFFNKKSRNGLAINESSQREIIVHENETISLSTMVLTETIQGHIFVRDLVVVDTNAIVTGEITSTKVIVNGKVTGDITCIDELIVTSTAIIDGNFVAHKATIEAGAIIRGSLSITEKVADSQLQAKILYAQSILNNRAEVSKVGTLQKQPVKEEVVYPKSESHMNKKFVKKEETMPLVENENTSGDAWW